MDSLIGEVFDDVSFDDFEEENMVSSSSHSLCCVHIVSTHSHLDDSQAVSVGRSLPGHCGAPPPQTPVHQLT